MSEQDGKEFIERFTVRMPMGMRERIADRAEKNGRSMNSEIVQILQDILDDRVQYDLPDGVRDSGISGTVDILSANKELLHEQASNYQKQIAEQRLMLEQLEQMKIIALEQKQLQEEINKYKGTFDLQKELIEQNKKLIEEITKNK
ncbi:MULTISPECIES: Arc family DNA-binding protein [Providencia]|uniref:Arc family DNA-binding protein n=1 Tax=Providencia TaxID=586 RepID=UPI001B37A0A1|nr:MULTISPECIES: Arc family DNA-binding protein [Providencia]ELR5106841.1 Arc family DNA-binding protein [Providencia rettgeri]MBQ0317337.1 Arc family DNA-binding protein [Providencia rettgeri]MBQ0322123.1 Arc family DNA-binding protein [Providencia rettgeri]MBQ0348624.1 Arc family DNA-binding protein [Providencia rettgeri]MBQ0404804.1 Arc family DNA-binding protein [Providencia rettgeri]